MRPFPTPAGVFSDDCFASTSVSENAVKSLCSVAYKAAVNASGVVRLTPLSTATFAYSQVAFATKGRLMPCKNLNASGLLNGAPLPSQWRQGGVKWHVVSATSLACMLLGMWSSHLLSVLAVA
jgi:hypothetical protein